MGKAVPDECWQPPADPNDPSQYGIYSTSAPTYNAKKKAYTCPTGYVPKVNQAYVWGLTRTGDNLWFGTVANTQCLVMGSYLGMTTPMLNQTSVCEFGRSPSVTVGVPPFIPANTIPAGLGDWRPPRLFTYAMGSSAQPVDLTTLSVNATTKSGILAGLAQTIGIRSAGSMDDPFNSGHKIIIFAGPSLAQKLMMFAFRDDGTFLVRKQFNEYNDIRRWVTTSDNKVFTGVGLTSAGSALSPSGDAGGAVLQWTPPTTATGNNVTDYLSFTPITYLDSDAAELTLAGDKLVAGTWPSSGHEASVWIADDPISTISTTTTWTRIWTVSDYDPDAVTAATYGAGAMAYYNGYVYWGTMHVPGQAFEAAEQAHPSSTSQEGLANFVGSYRAISIFRAQVNPTVENVELLYGEPQLPAYDYGSGSWQAVDNNMGGVAGLYGSSGFGNLFNNYTWSMAVYGGKLYVGTMDWSYLASQAWPELVVQLGLPADTPNPLNEIATYGADLWRFPSETSAATAVFANGVGNYLNYGVRNMLSVEDAASANNGLYLGMANPENLATTGGGPKGGWELLKLITPTK